MSNAFPHADVAVAAAPAVDGASASLPRTPLDQLVQSPPSHDGLAMLAQHYEVKCMPAASSEEDSSATANNSSNNNNNDNDSVWALSYLHAAAQHLDAAVVRGTTMKQELPAAAAAAQQQQPNACSSSFSHTAPYHLTPVVESVLTAVAWCVSAVAQRSDIVTTNILPVLAKLCYLRHASNNDDLEMDGSNGIAISHPKQQPVTERQNVLTLAHVVYLQACIFAQQYDVCERCVEHTWPRPKRVMGDLKMKLNSASMRSVLLYYYYRSVVHLGATAQDNRLALRCLWTCLSLPAASDTIVSAVQVAAWKKMVLIQCLCSPPVQNGTTSGEYASSKNPERPGYGSAAVLAAAANTTETRDGSAFHTTPREMPLGLTKYIANAAVPTGSRSITTQTPVPSRSAARSPPRRGVSLDDIMIDVENDTTSGNDVVMHVVDDDDDGDDAMVASETTKEGDKKNRTYAAFGVAVYRAMIAAFLTVEKKLFDAIVEEHGDLFDSDGNSGLIQRVQLVLLHRKVYAVASTFSKIALTDLAQELSIPSVERVRLVLEDMKAQTKWPVLVQDDGIVVFPDSQPAPDATVVATSKYELENLGKTIQKLDVAIASSKKFSGALRKDATKGENGSEGQRGVEDL